MSLCTKPQDKNLKNTIIMTPCKNEVDSGFRDNDYLNPMAHICQGLIMNDISKKIPTWNSAFWVEGHNAIAFSVHIGRH